MNHKEVKVIMLPTDKPTNIIKDRGRLEYIEKAQVANTINSIVEGFHLYVTSDDEIKEGDWYLYQNAVVKCSVAINGWVESDTSPFYTGLLSEGIKKVIASTDTSLGLPSLKKPFVEVYVKEMGKVGKLVVEYTVESYIGEDLSFCDQVNQKYRNIPKVEPDNTIIIYLYAERKPKAKESWSKEEVIEILNSLKLDESGEMQSMAEMINNGIFNSHIDKKIEEIKS